MADGNTTINVPTYPGTPSTPGFGSLNDPLTLLLLGGGLGGVAGATPAQGNTTTNLLANLLSHIQSTQQTGIDTRQDTGYQQTGTTTAAGATTPLLGPEAQALLTQLTGKYMGLTAPNLTGYGAMQTANINQAADAQRNALNSALAARGLATSPVAATAQAGIEQNRLNQVTAMQQQLPLLQHQMNLQNLAGAAGFFGAIPKGQATTGTTTQTGTGSTSATQTGGVTTVNDILNQATQQSLEKTKTSQGGGLFGSLGGIASGVAALLPYLIKAAPAIAASDARLKKDIKDISQDKAIEKIRNLRSREWTWKGGETKSEGFVAQEMEKVMPELVEDINIKDTTIKGIKYAGLIPYLVSAVQNLDSRIGQGE
jgi:hypothetical protein